MPLPWALSGWTWHSRQTDLRIKASTFLMSSDRARALVGRESASCFLIDDILFEPTP